MRTFVATGKSCNNNALFLHLGRKSSSHGRYHKLCKVFKLMAPKLTWGSHLTDIYVPYLAGRSKSSRRKNQSLYFSFSKVGIKMIFQRPTCLS